MRTTLSSALLATLLAVPTLTAQSAPCLSMNWGGNTTFRYRTATAPLFAIQATNDATLRYVDGLEFYTLARSSSQVVNVGIWDAAGPMSSSGTQLASGTMTMTTTLGACKATFATPAVLAPNTKFWITFDHGTSIYMSSVLPGTGQTHYWRNSNGWSGPWTGTWSWRVYCRTGTPASYTTFGTGCAGASAGCLPKTSYNWTQSLASRTTTAKKIAIFEPFSSGSGSVCGVAFRCQARTTATDVTVTVHEVDSSTFGVGKALTSTTVRIGTQSGVYVAKLSPPVTVPASSLLYFAFDKADELVLPVTTSGVNGLHAEFDGKSWSAVKSDTKWTYRIDTIEAGTVPQLAANGRPILGTKFDVVLAKAAPGSGALFVLGSSDRSWGAIPLPFELKLFNSPGCFLRASNEMSVVTVTSSTGNARVTLPIPNDTSLAGLNFYNQFLVFDMKRLAIVVSNAGKATIGTF